MSKTHTFTPIAFVLTGLVTLSATALWSSQQHAALQHYVRSSMSVATGPVCGDGVCEGEEKQYCTEDCTDAVCGDGVCDYSEIGTCLADGCEASRCTDTDMKDDFAKKGTVRADGKNRRTDYCIDTVLHQYQCKRDRLGAYTYNTVTYDCENGCSDGVCVGGTSGSLITDIKKRVSVRQIRIDRKANASGGTVRTESRFTASGVTQSAIARRYKKITSQWSGATVITGSTGTGVDVFRSVRRNENRNAFACRNDAGFLWRECALQQRAEKLGDTAAVEQFRKLKCRKAKREPSYRREYAKDITDCPEDTFVATTSRRMHAAAERRARRSTTRRSAGSRPSRLQIAPAGYEDRFEWKAIVYTGATIGTVSETAVLDASTEHSVAFTGGTCTISPAEWRESTNAEGYKSVLAYKKIACDTGLSVKQSSKGYIGCLEYDGANGGGTQYDNFPHKISDDETAKRVGTIIFSCRLKKTE